MFLLPDFLFLVTGIHKISKREDWTTSSEILRLPAGIPVEPQEQHWYSLLYSYTQVGFGKNSLDSAKTSSTPSLVLYYILKAYFSPWHLAELQKFCLGCRQYLAFYSQFFDKSFILFLDYLLKNCINLHLVNIISTKNEWNEKK